MKTNNIFLRSIVSVMLIAFAFSCEKQAEPEPVSQEPEMPLLTHTGANTFGCYIDGELFVANEGPSVWSIPPVSGSFDEETRELKVQGARYLDSDIREFVIVLSHITNGLGDYGFDTYNGGVIGYRNHGGNSCDFYYGDSPGFGILNVIFLDETSNIISGTFSMTLINLNCPEKKEINITEGRFDFRY